MKKVLIIGASGSLAAYVIDALQQHGGVALTLFVRNRNRLAKQNPGHTVIEGSVQDDPVLKKAVEGQDIVYVNLAGDLENMIAHIVKAMKETGVKRIIAISSIGIYQTPLKPVLVPYRRLADIIEASGLDYTILRPDWFTYADEVDYTLTFKNEPETGTAVSRKSIAAFIATIIENPELYRNENIGISEPQ